MIEPEVKRYLSRRNQDAANKRWGKATPEDRARVGRIMAEARKAKRESLSGTEGSRNEIL